ncbi:MAG: glucokinase [Reyranella sp.]|nr:glucokinase [Reyranella sp.]
MRRLLLADVGGSNARFAVLAGDELGPIRSFDVHAFPTIADSVCRFLAEDTGRTTFDGAVFAVAGPVTDGRCALTNSPWIVDAANLKDEFGLKTVHLLNDHEALARALPHLAPSETVVVGPSVPGGDAPMALIGPGTGLGMACLVPGPGGGRVMASEGGHATLAAATDREDAIIAALRRQYGHVSAERVLSGDGLVNLYRATAAVDGVTAPPRTAAEVSRAGLDGTCVVCRTALDTFCAWLGAVAGDVALLLGARGGVFIGGGIVPRFVDHLASTDFRARFEAKGRLKRYLAAIPVRVIVRPNPAFVGLAAFVRTNVDQAGG